jgi:L-seryl-tRNA(Ser) seleniumtransferase
MKTSVRRQIPAVSRILKALNNCDLPRPFIVELVRRKVSEIRASRDVPQFETIVAGIRRSLDDLRASRLQSVVNGTGIVIHTNFGRAPLATAAGRALAEFSSGYSNLEFQLATGERGQRGGYVQTGLALLCKAEAATVVNNCAAALVLIASHFTTRNIRRRTSNLEHRSEIVI